jgi:hypothetical protein
MRPNSWPQLAALRAMAARCGSGQPKREREALNCSRLDRQRRLLASTHQGGEAEGRRDSLRRAGACARARSGAAGSPRALQRVVGEQLLDQVHVCHHHAPAAVALEAQRVEGVTGRSSASANLAAARAGERGGGKGRPRRQLRRATAVQKRRRGRCPRRLRAPLGVVRLQQVHIRVPLVADNLPAREASHRDDHSFWLWRWQVLRRGTGSEGGARSPPSPPCGIKGVLSRVARGFSEGAWQVRACAAGVAAWASQDAPGAELASSLLQPAKPPARSRSVCRAAAGAAEAAAAPHACTVAHSSSQPPLALAHLCRLKREQAARRARQRLPDDCARCSSVFFVRVTRARRRLERRGCAVRGATPPSAVTR